jgi:hypothetical protein
MTARHIHTGKIYEGSKSFIASIVGKHRNTLSRWEQSNKESYTVNNYEVRFLNIIRESNNRGSNNKK